MKTYDGSGKGVVQSHDDLSRLLSDADGPYYVYVLCVPPASAEMVPFYVGIGQASRLFAHEDEARDPAASNRKVDRIREIWRQGGDVVRVLDGFFSETPWRREEELITEFGLEKDGSGILVNEQRYSPSFVQDGVELRKYAADGNELPDNFIRRHTRLMVGPKTPRNIRSVYGKICAVLEDHPGVTGEELVELLLSADFSENQSAYTANGAVSRPWVAKYIDGGFYKKNQFIQDADKG